MTTPLFLSFSVAILGDTYRPPTLVDCCWHFLSVVDTVDFLVMHAKQRVVEIVVSTRDDYSTLFTSTDF